MTFAMFGHLVQEKQIWKESQPSAFELKWTEENVVAHRNRRSVSNKNARHIKSSSTRWLRLIETIANPKCIEMCVFCSDCKTQLALLFHVALVAVLAHFSINWFCVMHGDNVAIGAINLLFAQRNVVNLRVDNKTNCCWSIATSNAAHKKQFKWVHRKF